MSRTQTLSPLVLSAKCRFPAAGVTGVGPLSNLGVDDLSRLYSPSHTPYLIDEIRFSVWNPKVRGAQYVIGCRLSINRLELTSGRYIPIVLFGPALDLTTEDNALDNQTMFSTPFGAVPQINAAQIVWRLPKPLYVPPNEAVVPLFRIDPVPGFRYGDNGGGAGFGDSIVYVTYIGRVLHSDSPIPAEVDVPFIGAWVDPVARASGSDYLAVRSTRSDLKNPHGEVVYVQRMLGTYTVPQPGNGAGAAVSYLGPGGDGVVVGGFGVSAGQNLVEPLGNDFVTTRLFKSDGSVIARDETPWTHLFDWATRSFDICGILEPNEFYMLQSDIRLSSVAAQACFPVGAGPLRLMASVVGYRKVAFAPGGINYVEAA